MSRQQPSDGLKLLLGYYAGEGPTMDKLRAFLLEYLVYDASQVPESMIEERFRASIDPEVIANPPLMGPIKDPVKVDFLLDPRLKELQVPTLVLWGTEDKVNPPEGALLLQKNLPNCDVFLFARTGHWVQWERCAQFNASTISFLQS